MSESAVKIKRFKYRDHENHDETLIEDIFNSISHGVATGLSIAAMVLMIIFGSIYGNAMTVVTTAVFGAALTMTYSSSTLYHAMRRPSWLRIMDHVCIYLLIAGTYTPFMLVTMPAGWGWSLFGVSWGMAFFGILFKIFGKSKKYGILATGAYVLMGWAVVIAIVPMYYAMSSIGFTMILLGGGIYTLGVFFYLWDHLPFNHMIWHFFVMGGSACHVIACFYDVVFLNA